MQILVQTCAVCLVLRNLYKKQLLQKSVSDLQASYASYKFAEHVSDMILMQLVLCCGIV